jgi:uncharacterized protein
MQPSPNTEAALPASPQPPQSADRRNWAAWPFVSDRGLRSGWRVVIFLVLVIGGAQGVMQLLRALGLKPHHGPLTPDIAILGETILLVCSLIATGIMALFERRRLGSYGLGLRPGFFRRFATGAVWGIVPLAALLLGLRALGVADFGGSDVAGRALLRAGVLYGVAFILTGIFEQSAMRGYPLYTLMRSVGFWPAAVITSALFALVHLGNSGEAIVGLLGVFVVGMIFCLMVRRTGDLWFAIGNHFAWDYGETFIFGVPNSGTTAAGHLLTTHMHGSRWLTGGSVGPEGSLFVFVVLGLLALTFHFAYPRARLVATPDLSDLRNPGTAGPSLHLG